MSFPPQEFEILSVEALLVQTVVIMGIHILLNPLLLLCHSGNGRENYASKLFGPSLFLAVLAALYGIV